MTKIPEQLMEPVLIKWPKIYERPYVYHFIQCTGQARQHLGYMLSFGERRDLGYVPTLPFLLVNLRHVT